MAYDALGQKKESDTALNKLIANYPESAYAIAQVYVSSLIRRGPISLI
jgi:hypothetical protein